MAKNTYLTIRITRLTDVDDLKKSIIGGVVTDLIKSETLDAMIEITKGKTTAKEPIEKTPQQLEKERKQKEKEDKRKLP